MVDPQRERVHQYLLDRLADGVRRRPGSWLSRLSRQFFSATEATYAFEHAGCDAERGYCTGEVRGAWLIDPNGVHAVEASPESVPGERRGMWYRFNRVQFYISPAGDWVILAALDGPRAGCGGRYRVVPEGAGFVLVADGGHWRA
jgi:hypothetical protein